jgi:hypothetical protein
LPIIFRRGYSDPNLDVLIHPGVTIGVNLRWS